MLWLWKGSMINMATVNSTWTKKAVLPFAV